MKKGVKTIALCAILLFSYYIGITNWPIAKGITITDKVDYVENVNELAVAEEEAKTYNRLDINALYAGNANFTSQERIRWVSRGGTYQLLLPSCINMENVRLDFSIHNDVLLSVYDSEGNLINKIHSGETVPLKDGNYTFKLETNVKEVTSYNVRVIHSTVPSIHIALNGGVTTWKRINGSSNHSYTGSGLVTVAEADGKLYRSKLTEMRGRGNATWKRDKKPYIFKMEDKISIAGMNAGKSWILLSNHMDGSLSRNYIWYNLGKDLELPFTPEVNPVDVYVNNEYQGSYLLASKIQANSNRVDIDVDNGDFIIEKDFHPAAGRLSTNKGMRFNIEEPSFDGMDASARNAKKQEITAFLNKVESLIFSGANTEELSQYLDFESFAKFYWVQEISLNVDGDRGSCYLYMKDGKLYAGPIWDMDTTMNRSYNYASIYGWYISEGRSIAGRQSYSWYARLVQRRDFSDELDKVFIKYKDVFTSLPDKIKAYGDEIETTATMNYIRWPYSTMYAHQRRSWSGGNGSWRASVNTLANNTRKRVNWFVNQYDQVIYEKLSYEVYYKDYLLQSGDIESGKQIELNSSVTTDCVLKVYGVNGDSKKQIKSYTLKDEEIYEDILLQQKTSGRKSYIRNSYKVSFKMMGGNICEI